MSSKKGVVIAGAGGVGFWLAAALARSVDGTVVPMFVYDGDTLSGSGGRRLPFCADPDHTYKVSALRAFISFTMRDPVPKLFERELTGVRIGDHSIWGVDQLLVVDATDMPGPNRQLVYDATIAAGYEYLRISYDGNGWVTVARGLPFERPGDTVGGYDLVPSLAQSMTAGGIGASAVIQWLEGKSVAEYQVNVNSGECLSTFGQELV